MKVEVIGRGVRVGTTGTIAATECCGVDVQRVNVADGSPGDERHAGHS